MIIYNVTINIDDTVSKKWLDWMTDKHIPEILATGMFVKAVLVKVMIVEEMGGTTYSVQYHAENHENLKEYYEKYAPAFREEGLKLFGDKMLAFRTELEVIQEFKPL